MRQRRISVTGAFWLQLAVSIFLVTLGIAGLTKSTGRLLRGGAFFRGGEFNTVASIIELAGGGTLLVVAVAGVYRRFFFWVGIALFALWLMLILEAFFMRGFLEPNFLLWLNRLAWYAVVAIALWIVARQYR
jgi:hypothetical protein